jgi:CBS domain-containing protein
MLCTQIMQSVECLLPSDTAETAARLMRDQDIGFLPVCDSELKVVGTLTDHDLVTRLVAERQPGSTPVESIMTREVVACSARETVERVEELMGLFGVGRILCTDDDGTFRGLISRSDLAGHRQAARLSIAAHDAE